MTFLPLTSLHHGASTCTSTIWSPRLLVRELSTPFFMKPGRPTDRAAYLSSNRQEPDSLACDVHGDNSPCIKVIAACLDCAEYDSSDCARQKILRSNLKYAWAASLVRRKERSKIKIVRENNQAILGGVIENLRVGSRSFANRRPVQGVESMHRKKRNPGGAQIHVDQDLHAPGIGSSSSSTRQAAYPRACRMSSSSM